MDFPKDQRSLNIGDQFLFGPSIMVSPVTEEGAVTRHLYLPAGSAWTDFWNNSVTPGGKMIDAPAPLNSLPLFIRAGAIIPMGPDIEYSTEKPADPIELRVYPGADGDFTLYEDENENYNYEKGIHSTIAMHWEDAGRTLKIAAREGSFPGMPASRTFHVVAARPGHGAGSALTTDPDQTVNYAGTALEVKLP
jgi:alpha-D-xyloside xylohydrolase